MEKAFYFLTEKYGASRDALNKELEDGWSVKSVTALHVSVSSETDSIEYGDAIIILQKEK